MSFSIVMIKSGLTSKNLGVFKKKKQGKDFKALLPMQMHFYGAHIPE